MVNGPPTPPPTTATELQDEARENPLPAEAASSLLQNPTEQHYQHILASIIEAISNKDYPLVINIAQETDYDVFLAFVSFV